MKENSSIEYKAKLTDGLEKEVVAFLNKDGGQLYIGVNDNGQGIGLNDTNSDMLKIKDRLNNNISPSCLSLFNMVSEVWDGHEVIKITLDSGFEKPYYIKKKGMSEKGCYIRIGTAAEPMPRKMIDELYAKRTRNSIRKIKSNKQTLKFEQLKIYYQESGKELNQHFASNLELIIEDGSFNYVGYLLSDVNNISIKVAKYKGLTREILIENNEYGNCSLIKATKSVLDKIDLENKTITQITAKERGDIRLWTPIALREAIINALVHNDYSIEAPPKFEIFDDRIEITSSGGLPIGLSQTEFFEGYSVPRNNELMRVFKDIRLVEQLGSGVPRILRNYKRESFKFSDNFLRVTFPKATSGTIGGTISGTIDDLTDKQKDVLEAIINNNKLSYRKLAQQMGIHLSAVQKHIEVLKNKKYIERIGGTRGYWKVTLPK